MCLYIRLGNYKHHGEVEKDKEGNFILYKVLTKNSTKDGVEYLSPYQGTVYVDNKLDSGRTTELTQSELESCAVHTGIHLFVNKKGAMGEARYWNSFRLPVVFRIKVPPKDIVAFGRFALSQSAVATKIEFKEEDQLEPDYPY